MLFDAFSNPRLSLANRVVMAPMTRSRATLNNTANAQMAKYYAQRASAGLIITEGTSPSPDGLGYARIPGIFTAAHVSGWGQVTDAVHRAGGKIFCQLMHTGRVSAQDNLPSDGRVVGPTSTPCPGKMFTDTAGMQPHTAPHALTEAEVAATVEQYAAATELAIDAGFDGVELHGANGYLIEQFLNANVNTRTDSYGGDAARRNRFALDIATACVARVGADKVAMRLSPHGAFNATGAYDGVDAQYLTLAKQLGELQLVYLHVLDHSSQGAPAVPAELKRGMRQAFGGVFMLCGGYDAASANAELAAGNADLIAFGRPFIANPDLVDRMQRGVELAKADPTTFYSPGTKGYSDYPTA